MNNEFPRCFGCSIEVDLASEVEVVIAPGKVRYYCADTCRDADLARLKEAQVDLSKL